MRTPLHFSWIRTTLKEAKSSYFISVYIGKGKKKYLRRTFDLPKKSNSRSTGYYRIWHRISDVCEWFIILIYRHTRCIWKRQSTGIVGRSLFTFCIWFRQQKYGADAWHCVYLPLLAFNSPVWTLWRCCRWVHLFDFSYNVVTFCSVSFWFYSSIRPGYLVVNYIFLAA